ncbi:MAG: S9 family peptidase [Clostridia bacterium]
MNKNAFSSKDLMKMKWVGNPTLSPDGEKLLYELTEVNEEENDYSTNLYLYDGKEHIQFSSNCGQKVVKNKSPQFSPDGTKIAFISNRSDKDQLWLYKFKGEAVKITEAPQGISSFTFSPDSQYIYYLAKEKEKEKNFPEKAKVTHITKLKYKFNGTGYLDGITKQIYQLNLNTKEVKQITHLDSDAGNPIISPDGQKLAFSANLSSDEQNLTQDIYVYNLNQEKLERITNGKGRYDNPLFINDNELIYSGLETYPYPGGYPDLYKTDINNKNQLSLTDNYEEFIGRRVGNDVSFDNGNTGLKISEDKKYAYFIITKGGNCYLERINLETKETNRVYGSGKLVVASYDIKNGCLAADIADPLSPGDIWIGKNFSLEKITDYNSDLFEDKFISYPENISFINDEGIKLEGWLLKPIDFDDTKKHKLIMEIHGGPHTTYGNIFFHEFQILAGKGYAVFYSNPRGSMGYGEDFARAVVGDWCGSDARDLEFMAKEVSKLDWIDQNHLGVTGGSQGGYFTNWLISHTNIFSAAVTQRSMSNLYTKYGIADNGWNGDRYGMGGADLWDNEDFVLERSPIRYAPNVNTPLLLIHSDNDLRCPLEQAEQWYVALKRLGNITEMLIFHGENHNLSRSGKPANRLVRLDAILDWFEKYC